MMGQAARTRRRIGVWQVVAVIIAGAALLLLGFAAGRVSQPGSTSGLGVTGATARQPAAVSIAPSDTGADDLGSIGAAGAAGADGSSPEGAVVDEAAVAALEADLAGVDLAGSWFQPGTAVLDNTGADTITRLSEVVRAHPGIPVEVEIHSYSEISPGENHGLSVLQAQAVVTALVATGVEAERLTAVGLGDSGLEIPEGVDAAIRIDSSDSMIDRSLADIDTTTITLDGDVLASSSDAAIEQIASVLTAAPAADVRLVGYAYADDGPASHDRSHLIIDEVAERLVELGVDRERMDLIGLSDTPVSVGPDVEVELEAGTPDDLTMALRQIDKTLIQFEPGTTTLTAEGVDTLLQVASALALDPERRVRVAIHTFTEPTSSENHRLSHQQATAVRNVLGELAIEPDRLDLVGHGDPEALKPEGLDSFVSFYPLD